MGTIENTSGDGREHMQDFIFKRELAEVYLLLDHLSGRSDKSLTAALADNPEGVKVSIEEICAISWPPNGSAIEQARQATTLLVAKDRLNAAAKPANGASIAFTLLVAGHDEEAARKTKRGWLLSRCLRRICNQLRSAPASVSAATPAQSAAPIIASTTQPPPAANNAPANEPANTNGGGRTPPPRRFWSEPPSRGSLARQAYPGLVAIAAHFNRQINIIIGLLVCWLIWTCVLSWHVAAGHTILGRLAALETEKNTIEKRISDAEVNESKAASSPTGPAGTNRTPPSPETGAAPPNLILRYCDRIWEHSPIQINGHSLTRFRDVTQRQICDAQIANDANFRSAREDLAYWLVPWCWLKGFRHCPWEHNHPASYSGAKDQQWATVLVEVLATAVLPLFYGFLGAGAAVVRSIWGKMRDSLLSPRDLTLSLGQLALGAVIGACIGLFVSPSGAATPGGGITAVSLTPPALSFIAGFSVEGVFVALEAFIKRVFALPDPKPN